MNKPIPVNENWLEEAEDVIRAICYSTDGEELFDRIIQYYVDEIAELKRTLTMYRDRENEIKRIYNYWKE